MDIVQRVMYQVISSTATEVAVMNANAKKTALELILASMLEERETETDLQGLFDCFLAQRQSNLTKKD